MKLLIITITGFFLSPANNLIASDLFVGTWAKCRNENSKLSIKRMGNYYEIKSSEIEGFVTWPGPVPQKFYKLNDTILQAGGTTLIYKIKNKTLAVSTYHNDYIFCKKSDIPESIVNHDMYMSMVYAWEGVIKSYNDRIKYYESIIGLTKKYFPIDNVAIERCTDAIKVVKLMKVDVKNLQKSETDRYYAAQDSLQNTYSRMMGFLNIYHEVEKDKALLTQLYKSEGIENRINVANQKFKALLKQNGN